MIINKLISKFKNNSSEFIQNINKDHTKNQKRLLISYINNNYNLNYDKDEIFATNIFESQQIVKVFSELDFSIDLAYCNNNKIFDILKQKQYDYIFGFGDVFYEACKLNPKAVKIMYSTENPPWFSLLKEKERINYYYERKKKRIDLTRSLRYYKEEHFNNIDYCITLGEIELYKDKSFKLYRMYPTGLFNSKFNINKLNNNNNNNNKFLWFGSRGVVHKGLDILVDIFNNQSNAKLIICGLQENERKFLDIKDNGNIEIIGKINVKSDKFIQIANECDFVILPSCSEATATGVLTCMRHGLIPVVQKDIGFNCMQEYAIVLNDYKVEYIEQKIERLKMMKIQEIINKRKEIYEFSNQKFDLQNFTKEFRRIIINIINNEMKG